MINNSTARLLGFIAAITASSSALSAMSLDRMVVYFKPDKLPRQDVIVTNPDPENLYLQTEVYKVINPGTEQEERIQVTDPAQIKLLATPGKTVVPPNGRKTVRLISMETPKDKELVYRVDFRPVIGELKTEQTAVKLLIAYQALVLVRPQNPEYKVSAKVSNGKMTFTNSGNINVVLRNGKYCTDNKPESCTDLGQGTRIYAGGSWDMPLPKEARKGFIKYGLFDGDLEKTETFEI